DVPRGAQFVLADLEDATAISQMARGCGAVLHFGGISMEEPFETVIGPNIRGLYNVYEAVRREKARMVFASSHHVVGFYERGVTIDQTSPMRPDGYYGLSKAYGELMGRMYWDKHAVESVLLRIGVSRPEPLEDRMLTTWLSHDDLVRLVERSVLASALGCIVVWGVSNNRRMTWWQGDSRDVLDWHPQDSADPFVPVLEGRTSGNAITERYQGAGFCTRDYSRTTPSPKALFAT
ncbi:MAG: NAD(P)-dependent oxidoreductase, partial [Proteobacteria bacterium]|nr:NAD(P)-dependent oxidoreductase [Pseudomonadota bacterium]